MSLDEKRLVMNAYSHTKTSIFERLFYTLFPESLLHGTPWREQWKEKERRESINLWRYFFFITAVAYVLHYYLLDKPMELQPLETWIRYRFGLAGLSLTCFILFFVRPFYQSRAFRVPVYIFLWATAYMQAKSMVWYDGSLYLYAFAFVVIGSVVLRTSLLKSMIYAVFTLTTQYSFFLQTDVSPPLIYSATAVTLLFVYILRSKYMDDIRYFLVVQQNTLSQNQVIELNTEFSDQIRSLLPREISRRLTYYLSKRRLSVLQAMGEILQPTQKEICCLYSDIRGFTEGTKDLDRFINHGVLPNVRECTSAVEQNGGIPRKIGDLVFAYFDDDNKYVNLVRSIQTGIDIAKINQSYNETNSSQVYIQRHILISTGEAIVGNLGGMDSSIEITALGSPVNLLSRLDELTKSAALKPHLEKPCLILCDRTTDLLREINLNLDLKKIVLSDLGLKIRNFEDIDQIWLIEVNVATERLLGKANNYIQQKYHDRFTLPN